MSSNATEKLHDLPPLPKSLRGLLSVGRGQWKEVERLHSLKTSIQEDLHSEQSLYKPKNLDAALALLRKEMVSLRQLDISLLCQLWSLNECIDEYKASRRGAAGSVGVGDSTTTTSTCSSSSHEDTEEEEEEGGEGEGDGSDTYSLADIDHTTDEYCTAPSESGESDELSNNGSSNSNTKAAAAGLTLDGAHSDHSHA